jgi:hypothetical protein
MAGLIKGMMLPGQAQTQPAENTPMAVRAPVGAPARKKGMGRKGIATAKLTSEAFSNADPVKAY